MSELDKFNRAIASDAQMRHLQRQHAAARTNAQKNRIVAEMAEVAARISRRIANERAN